MDMVKQRVVEENPVEERPAEKEEAFDTGTVLTLSGAHLANDIYGAMLAPILPLLIKKLFLSMTAAGALVTVLKAGGLIQPFFGMWADRSDARYFVIFAPTLTALTMSLVGIAPNYWAIVILLIINGFSVAAFHPAAAASVTRASGRTWGKGMSGYMFGGEMGRSLGPLLIVNIVAYWGLDHSYLVAIPGIAFSILLYWRLRHRQAARMVATSAASIWEAVKAQKKPLLLLSGLILFRSTAITSFATFFPAYMMGKGSSLQFAGSAIALYELCGAAGALFGGTLSDRFGRRAMMLVSQMATGPLLYLALVYSREPLGLTALAIAGFMAMSANPVQLTLAQELLPGSRSTASGIVFFLGFEGSLFTLVVGAMADWIGLGPALGFSVLASMLSIPFTLALPEPRRRR
jgi:FSR family fosmidomycin resistance protein-like MFS transporter